MRIHNENPVNRLHGFLDHLERAGRMGRTGAVGEAGNPCRTGETARLGRDGFVVSTRAREIAELRLTIDDLPDVRELLVDRLRDEIASGRYRADGRRIADAMLDEERAFAGRVGARRP